MTGKLELSRLLLVVHHTYGPGSRAEKFRSLFRVQEDQVVIMDMDKDFHDGGSPKYSVHHYPSPRTCRLFSLEQETK